ncbi:MAG: right-handed parallel beta-helix repeat-containing protein, partial [Methanobacterium sp.]
MVIKKKNITTILILISIFFGLTGIINTSEAHILVIGDSLSDTPSFYDEAKQIAFDLKQRGYQVLELYRSNATSENILKGMYDADAVIYVGHGAYQAGNYNNNGGSASPPFALVGSDNYIWGIGDKMNEGWNGNLFYAPFKPTIPVILFHVCFSTGWVETKQVDNPIETIYNFARMFTGVKANYYATAWNGAEIVNDFLDGAVNFQDANNQNYEKITKSTIYKGVQVWKNDNGYSAFVGDWNGTFPMVSQTTAYNEAAADAWYHSVNRLRDELICNFFVNDSLHYINQPVSFTEGSYDFGGQILSYFWDFGDAKNLTDNTVVNPTHIYTLPGNYMVKHVVTDSLNRTFQFNQTITVLTLLYVNSNSGNDSWDGSSPTWIGGTIGPMKTISSAINALTTYGTINVAPGTYTENLNINTKLNLMGNDSKNTILKANNAQNAVVTINNSGSGSIIEGFNITGGASGVNLSRADNCTIQDNAINGNSIGVVVQGDNNSISFNNISNNVQGVYIGNNAQNDVIGNNITFSGSDGVYCDAGSDNFIEYNTISNGTRGITAKNSKNLDIEENKIANNTQDGINFDNTTNSTVKNNEITGKSQNGIKLQNSRNNNINYNSIQNNAQNNSGSGISLNNSSGNIINSNLITGNYDGVILQNNSNQNTITNNTLSAQNILINTSGSSGNTINNNQIFFTINQITTAAKFVNFYIETNYQLPASVNINEYSLNMAQFLELLMTAALQLNSGNSNLIQLKAFNNPSNPIDDIWAGNIVKTEYLRIANDLKIYMDSTGKTPDYQYQTSLGTHLGFQNLVYMYSLILYVNKVA